jgi:hypothetical protein
VGASYIPSPIAGTERYSMKSSGSNQADKTGEMMQDLPIQWPQPSHMSMPSIGTGEDSRGAGIKHYCPATFRTLS